MVNSRVNNTLRNSAVGIFSQLLNAGLAFICRTVFIKVLGVDYLGINGLFSNILLMLSLSDLGIYTVMTFSLYKPIAEGDKVKISVLIHYFQKLYNIIAAVVLGIGLLLIPFLPKLVNGNSLTYNELIKYYVILLLNSVVSYLAISRSTLFRADQKVYIVKIVTTISTVLMHLTQIALLLIFHDYTAYLICQVFFTFGSNVTLSLLAVKKYPFLKKEKNKEVTKEVNSKILNNLKASFFYKTGSVILNSTDNILISVIVSTAMVGYYSNYVTLFSLVNAFIIIFIEAVLASIGNYIATESDKNKYKLFKTLMLAMYFIACFCVSCYISGMNDFISVWIGDDFVIKGSFIFALATNRFVFCIIHPLWMMRESSGVFVETQYVMVSAAAINIFLSVVLGKLFGISGIIVATAISYLLTVYWYEPKQLFKNIFHDSVIKYWKYVIKLLAACIFPFIISVALYLYPTKVFILIILKFLVCGFCSVLSFCLLFRKTEEFGMFYGRLKKFFTRNS